MAYQKDCIFCKIVKGEVPSNKVYEDKKFYAFLDNTPLTRGHTLVIPKDHYRWVWDAPNIGEYYKVVQKIVNAIRKSLKTEMVMSLVAGEMVPHAHVWLIPRSEGDGHPRGWLNPKNVVKLSPEERKAIAQKILKAL